MRWVEFCHFFYLHSVAVINSAGGTAQPHDYRVGVFVLRID